VRSWLLLLFLAALVHAQLYYPPITSVVDYNEGLGSTLETGYNASSVVFSGLAIAGMSLMLDNATYPADGLAVLLQEQAPGDSVCDYAYPGTMTFYFRNLSYNESLASIPTIVPLPQVILAAMKDSSGADQLEVDVNSTLTGSYANGSSCINPLVSALRNLSFHTERNFTVFGTNQLYFLRAPLLREQWFEDNQFDTVILSQDPLSNAEIYLNGNLADNLTLRTFEVVTDSYGLQEILSNLSVPAGWSESVNLTAPALLETQPHSYAYIYEFNYSYEGLGQNNLSLVVTDSFLNSRQYDEQLLSRMLSYNGTTTETGGPIGSVPSRPSATFTVYSLSSFGLVFGLLALLLLLPFVNFWFPK
jgi:hypothetical protein